MGAKKLIELAASRGYAIGRNTPGEYRYGYNDGRQQVEKSFTGSWTEFVRLVKSLPDLTR